MATTLSLALLLALQPVASQAGTKTLRLDPEVLSGRIAQHLLGESELTSASGGTLAPSTAAFGTDIQLSDEHLPRQLISQTEPSITVSPANGQNLVAGFHDLFPGTQDFVCRIAFTDDGGQNWHLGGATPLQAQGNFCSDPALAADSDGNFYYAYLDINFGAIRSDVDVAKSTDGGHTFSTFSVAAQGSPRINFPDKEYIAVDHTGGPHDGTIYVSWTDFLNPQNKKALDNGQIKVVTSHDGGLTWSAPISISDSAQFPRAISGSDPVVAPDGTAYIFYADFVSGTAAGPLSIMFSKSSDGGAHWTAPAAAVSGRPSPGRFRLRNADPNFGAIANRGFRSNSFPSAAIAPDGTIYVTFVDFPEGTCKPDGTGRPPCENADVELIRSITEGAMWSSPVKATDETNGTDQFFPWIAVHPDGVLSIIWQDKRLDGANRNFDTFYTSTPDGVTFSPNQRVSSNTSLPGTATFIGDYNNLAVTATGIFPVWTDRRFRNNDIFTVTGTR